tara:strand:+ start:12972 stop:13298 length:327 start_codon:yes stop_codon:yes gene_type:complete
MAITYTYEFPKQPKVASLTHEGEVYENLLQEIEYVKTGTDENGISASWTETAYFACDEYWLDLDSLIPFADLTKDKIIQWIEGLGGNWVNKQIDQLLAEKQNTVALPF